MSGNRRAQITSPDWVGVLPVSRRRNPVTIPATILRAGPRRPSASAGPASGFHGHHTDRARRIAHA